MKQILWLLKWVLKAAIFFTLFAFALNNQQDATVHFFFGTQWRAPLVLVVLIVFTVGVVVGVLGMLPHWWKDRQGAQQTSDLKLATPAADDVAAISASSTTTAHGL
jgi:uncharacterized integral membrane protein